MHYKQNMFTDTHTETHTHTHTHTHTDIDTVTDTDTDTDTQTMKSQIQRYKNIRQSDVGTHAADIWNSILIIWMEVNENEKQSSLNWTPPLLSICVRHCTNPSPAAESAPTEHPTHHTLPLGHTDTHRAEQPTHHTLPLGHTDTHRAEQPTHHTLPLGHTDTHRASYTPYTSPGSYLHPQSILHTIGSAWVVVTPAGPQCSILFHLMYHFPQRLRQNVKQ